MRTSAAAVLLIACALLVAACGDSGSSSTTASVPTTRIGAAAQSCTPPRVNGLTIHALNATNVTCDAATAGVLEVIRTNKYPGWDCRQSISGRNVRVTCTNASDTSKSFSAAWSVS